MTEQNDIHASDATTVTNLEDYRNRPDSDYINPETVTDEEIYARTVSQIHKYTETRVAPEELHRLVRRLTNPNRQDELTDEQQAWLTSLRTILIDMDSTDLSPEERDELITGDTYLGAIYEALTKTRSRSADFKFERKILLDLRHLRAPAAADISLRTSGSEKHWHDVLAYVTKRM